MVKVKKSKSFSNVPKDENEKIFKEKIVLLEQTVHQKEMVIKDLLDEINAFRSDCKTSDNSSDNVSVDSCKVVLSYVYKFNQFLIKVIYIFIIYFYLKQ